MIQVFHYRCIWGLHHHLVQPHQLLQVQVSRERSRAARARQKVRAQAKARVPARAAARVQVARAHTRAPPVYLYRQQLREVLVNLLRNLVLLPQL